MSTQPVLEMNNNEDIEEHKN